LIYFIPSKVSLTILPILSDLNGQKDRAKFRKAFMLHMAINLFAASAFAIPIALFAGTIMNIYGSEYVTGRLALVLVCIGMISHAGVNVCIQNILSQGRTWSYWGMDMTYHLIRIVVSVYLAATGYGALGLAIGYVTAVTYYFLLLFFVINCFWNRDTENIHPNQAINNPLC